MQTLGYRIETPISLIRAKLVLFVFNSSLLFYSPYVYLSFSHSKIENIESLFCFDVYFLPLLKISIVR
jgi:hypothetical protein